MAQRKTTAVTTDSDWVDVSPAGDGDWADVSAAAAPSPTLLDSRRQASKREFENNLPESTMLTRARELILGGAEGLGVDPQSPILGTAKNIAGGLYGLGKGLLTHPVDTAVNAASGAMNPAIEAFSGLQEGDYDKMAHGVGGSVATYGPPAAAGAAAADQMLTKARALRAPLNVENRLAPRGNEAKAIATQAAPQAVADNSVPFAFRQTSTDARVLNGLHEAEVKINAAERSVPKGTTVQRDPILTEIDAAIDDMRVPGQPTQSPPTTNIVKGQYGWQMQSTPGTTTPQAVTGNQAGVNALLDIRKELTKLPDQVPFEDIRKLRQQIDKAISDHNGWSETATTADKQGLRASRQAAQAIRNGLKGISAELDAANAAYHQASQLAQVVKIRRPELRGFTDTLDAMRRAALPPPSTPSLTGRMVKYGVGAAAGGGIIGAGISKILGGN